MTKERFEIIKINLISLLNKEMIGLCKAIRKIHYNGDITTEEFNEVKQLLNNSLSKINRNYTFFGEECEYGNYRFPDHEKRIEFLNNLKENYEPTNS